MKNNFVRLSIAIDGYFTQNAMATINLSELFFFEFEHELNVGLTDELRDIIWRLHKTDYVTAYLSDSNGKIVEEWRLRFRSDSTDEKKRWQLAKAVLDSNGYGTYNFEGAPFCRVADLLKEIRNMQTKAMNLYIKGLIANATKAPVVEKPVAEKPVLETVSSEKLPKPSANGKDKPKPKGKK